ncbi:hypothetical protein [Delftia sp. DT-2]|uniref:hypothetical protein n=1 Tax=Delftia sp. DT-2 TaxID=3022772 RepID=UPI00233EF021|nr:hypothetical protein [Delftia sp. DT-2]MDC2861073.1 hypothetical protein [Delftia sp. DT-2]
MGSFSAIHWLIALLVIAPVAALMVVPAWRILQRSGHSGAWALLMLVPVLGFVVLWVLAFSKWPNDKDGKTNTSVPGIILGLVLVPLSIGSVVALSSAGIRVAGPIGETSAQRQRTPSGLQFDPSTARPVTPIDEATPPAVDMDRGHVQQPRTMTYEEAYGLPPASSASKN